MRLTDYASRIAYAKPSKLSTREVFWGVTGFLAFSLTLVVALGLSSRDRLPEINPYRTWKQQSEDHSLPVYFLAESDRDALEHINKIGGIWIGYSSIPYYPRIEKASWDEYREWLGSPSVQFITVVRPKEPGAKP